MSRPSPQEQAEIDAASEPKPADCRKCKYATITVAEGGCVRCGYYNNTKVAAELAASPDYPCSTFSPASPASPPVSADREGTDAIATMQRALGCLVLARSLAEKHIPNLVAEIEGAMQGLGSLVSSEETRRARPDRGAPEDVNAGRVRVTVEPTPEAAQEGKASR